MDDTDADTDGDADKRSRDGVSRGHTVDPGAHSFLTLPTWWVRFPSLDVLAVVLRNDVYPQCWYLGQLLNFNHGRERQRALTRRKSQSLEVDRRAGSRETWDLLQEHEHEHMR